MTCLLHFFPSALVSPTTIISHVLFSVKRILLNVTYWSIPFPYSFLANLVILHSSSFEMVMDIRIRHLFPKTWTLLTIDCVITFNIHNRGPDAEHPKFLECFMDWVFDISCNFCYIQALIPGYIANTEQTPSDSQSVVHPCFIKTSVLIPI